MSSEDEMNPETLQRYKDAFKKYAKNGTTLPVVNIIDAIQEAKEDYTDDDVVDALEVMEIKTEPINLQQFLDLIGIMKDPETIIDAFKVLDIEKRGDIDEDELRTILRKYAPNLKGKEIEEILERPQATKKGRVDYNEFVKYWSNQ